MKKPKVLVIVGPTAAGKTSLSIKLAKDFNGEVISADSRQVYKGLDIGSGKVTPEEMDGVPHHLLDVTDPMTVYTANDFKHDAAAATEEILSRGCLPVIAGGTFFYVDTFLGKITNPEVPPNEKIRSKLETKSPKELYALLAAKDPRRAEEMDPHNARRLIRALEIVDVLGKVPEHTEEELYETLTIGIDIDKETLHNNIHTRLIERLEDGMVTEVEGLLASGVTHDRLDALGLEYRYLSRYLRGDLSYEDMVVELEAKIRQFAKRQMTWLKRDTTIHWHKKDDYRAISDSAREFLG